MGKTQGIMLACQLSLGITVSICLALTLARHGFAQETDIDAELTTTPKLIVIPPTGYQPRSTSKESDKGEAEFKALNCIACHSIHGVGGTTAPILDGIGHRCNEEFLLARLTDSPEAKEKYGSLVGHAAAEIPHIRLTPDTAKSISSFLLTVPEPPGGFVIIPHVIRLPAEENEREAEEKNNPSFCPSAKSLSSEEGKQIYMRLGCVACHSIGKVGGWLAPSLDGIGARHTREYIVAHITNAKAEARLGDIDEAQISSRMPHFDATPEEIQKIADYLLTLPGSD